MATERSAATRSIVGIARVCSVLFLTAGVYSMAVTAPWQSGQALCQAASTLLLGLLFVFLSFTHSGQVFQFTVRRRLIAAILAATVLALITASALIEHSHS